MKYTHPEYVMTTGAPDDVDGIAGLTLAPIGMKSLIGGVVEHYSLKELEEQAAGTYKGRVWPIADFEDEINDLAAVPGILGYVNSDGLDKLTKKVEGRVLQIQKQQADFEGKRKAIEDLLGPEEANRALSRATGLRRPLPKDVTVELRTRKVIHQVRPPFPVKEVPEEKPAFVRPPQISDKEAADQLDKLHNRNS